MAFDYDEYLEAKRAICNQNENALCTYLTSNGLSNEVAKNVINALNTIPYHRKYPMYESTLLEEFIKALSIE